MDMTLTGSKAERIAVALFGALLLVVFLLPGCGGGQKRKEGIAELERIQTSIHGLQILITAGVTKSEYSQRLGDVLLKVGDLDSSMKATLPKFKKKDQAAVTDVYAHFSQSLQAYIQARDFYPRICDEDNDIGCSDHFRQAVYEGVKTKFPTLPDFPPPTSQFGYYRSDMLQALWKLAGEESAAASGLIQKLEQE
jgi:hypothetical protein